jgi:kynureninase
MTTDPLAAYRDRFVGRERPSSTSTATRSGGRLAGHRPSTSRRRHRTSGAEGALIAAGTSAGSTCRSPWASEIGRVCLGAAPGQVAVGDFDDGAGSTS